MNGVIFRHNDKSTVWYVTMTCLMFLYIYEFNLSPFGLPTLFTARRVAVGILIIWSLIITNRKKLPGKSKSQIRIKEYAFFLLFLLVYSYGLKFVFGGGEGEHITQSIIRLLILGIVPIYCLTKIIDNVDQMMRVILLATLLQSAFVVTCLIIPQFGVLLDLMFFEDDDAALIIKHRTEYAGGLACIAAPGTLRFSMGLIACLYFYLKSRSVKYMLLFFYLGFIATMIARTGLILSIVGILVILWRFSKENGAAALRIVGSLIVAGVVLVVFLSNVNISDYFEFSRLFDLIEGDGGSRFVDEYIDGKTTNFPDLSDNFFLGTGIVSGTTDAGQDIAVDGGFLSNYSALGFIMTLIFYIVTFTFFFRLMKLSSNKTIEIVMLYFIFIMFLAEFKENTLMKQYMIGLYCTISMLDLKKLRNHV